MSTKSWFDPLLAALAKAHAQRQLRGFIRAAHSAKQTQEQVLLAKLARNADSDYGREHGFSSIRSYADFIGRVPVQTYEDLQPYIERVMAGENRALFGRGQHVLMLAMTSGSTDTPKYVPVTPAFLNEYRRGWNIFGLKALLDHPGTFLRSILQVTSPMDERRTETGIPCGSISGLLAATQKRLVRKYYVVPRQMGYIGDAEARYYTIMRLALPCDVGWMVTASPATQLKLARTAAAQAEHLIRDIHDGTLQPPGEIPHPLGEALAQHLRPDVEAARRLAALTEEHGELLPRHYWNLAFLANWTGGTMRLHLSDFPHYFGDTPVRDIGLLATEGRASIPLEDGTPAGVLDVAGNFFEFIEAEADAADSCPVRRCTEVVPGREYRILMTTSAGLYRYDIGDRVRVHSFFGQAPVIEFLHRGAHVASVTGEKLTEWQATAAFERACRALALGLRSFVLAPQWAEPPFYRLHVDEAVADPRRLEVLCDGELSRLNLEYRSKRASGRLGPVILNQLPPGTLDRLDSERQRRRGGANEQYKHRFLYAKPGDDRALLDRANAERD